MRRLLFAFVLLSLCLPPWADPVHSQILGELQLRRLKDAAPLVSRDPKRSILEVRSAVEKLTVQSNREIIEFRKLKEGLYHVILPPGTHRLDFSSPGFQPIVQEKFYLPAGSGLTVQIQVAARTLGGRGGLRIRTDPEGATLELNSVQVAQKTPLSIEDQPAGPHRVRLVLDSRYQPIDTTLEVVADRVTEHSFSFTRKRGRLSVTTLPTGAALMLNGKEVGKAPLLASYPTGSYKLVTSKPGYRTDTRQVRVRDGRLTDVKVELSRFGTIQVTTVPGDAEIFFQGKSMGRGNATISDLRPGQYRISARAAGYMEASRTVSVKLGSVEKVFLPLSSSPALTVLSNPHGAEIAVNGTPRGRAPLTLDLKPGRYRIEASRKDYYPARKEVTLSDPRLYRVSLDLRSKEEGYYYPYLFSVAEFQILPDGNGLLKFLGFGTSPSQFTENPAHRRFYAEVWGASFMPNLHEEGDIRVRSQLDIVLMASLEYSLASSHKGILKPSNLSLFLTGSPLVFIEKPLYTHPDAPENTDDALVVDLSTPYFLTAGVRYRFATWFKLEAGYWLGPDITIGNRTADPPADPYTFELSRFYVSASLVFPGYQEMSKL